MNSHERTWAALDDGEEVRFAGISTEGIAAVASDNNMKMMITESSRIYTTTTTTAPAF